jgi:hypothetical protein
MAAPDCPFRLCRTPTATFLTFPVTVRDVLPA